MDREGFELLRILDALQHANTVQTHPIPAHPTLFGVLPLPMTSAPQSPRSSTALGMFDEVVPDVRFELTTYRLQGADSCCQPNALDCAPVRYSKPECEAGGCSEAVDCVNGVALVRIAVE